MSIWRSMCSSVLTSCTERTRVGAEGDELHYICCCHKHCCIMSWGGSPLPSPVGAGIWRQLSCSPCGLDGCDACICSVCTTFCLYQVDSSARVLLTSVQTCTGWKCWSGRRGGMCRGVFSCQNGVCALPHFSCDQRPSQCNQALGSSCAVYQLLCGKVAVVNGGAVLACVSCLGSAVCCE